MMDETIETNVIGNDIDKINKWLDECGVPRQHEKKLVGYTTWGRIAHILEERDRARAERDRAMAALAELKAAAVSFSSSSDDAGRLANWPRLRDAIEAADVLGQNAPAGR